MMNTENQKEFNQTVVKQFNGLNKQFDLVQKQLEHLSGIQDGQISLNETQATINEGFNRRLNALKKRAKKH